MAENDGSEASERYPQWQACPQGESHLAEWYPLRDQDDPRWFVRCRDCNVEGYVRPSWLSHMTASDG